MGIVLNEYQERAVKDESKACLVNAMVGSGKTLTLISKVLYLNQVKGIPYSDMVVLTFTNKASDEIKERIQGEDCLITASDMLYFGTFHSIALRFLKTLLPLERLGFTNDFSIIEMEAELALAQELITTHKLNIKHKRSLAKRLENVIKQEDDLEDLLKLLKEYKLKNNLMDFKDLLQYSTKLLKETDYHPSWLIIDEVQDCDYEQFAFIKSLFDKEKTKLFAVGDPNQIIYTWRGSNPKLLEQFCQEYQVTEYLLPINYRSSGAILEMAKEFLKEDSTLKGVRDEGKTVTITSQFDPFNEALYLADQIKNKVKQGYNYSDIAVLYRLQRQADSLEETFKKEGVPYEVSSKLKINDIPVLKWFLSLLKYAFNTKNELELEQIYKKNPYLPNITIKKVKKLIENQEADKLPLYEKLNNLASKIEEMTSPQELYDYLELDKYLNPTSITFEKDKNYITTLLSKIRQDETKLSQRLKQFLDSQALYSLELKEEEDNTLDKVKLLTLHSSKGLEFKVVYIIGVNEGLIPLYCKSLEEEKEEKRLFYVGVTRAKDELELLYYTQSLNGRIYAGPSTFISQFVQRKESSISDIQAIRKQILLEKETPKPLRQVKHNKYGVGQIIEEDDTILKVDFPQYGIKELLKDFCELEYL